MAFFYFYPALGAVLNAIQNPALGRPWGRTQPWAPAWRPALPRPPATAGWCGCCELRSRRPCCWPWQVSLRCRVFNPFRMARLPKLPVDIGNLVVSGTKITMELPHLAGFSTDQRPYELWAKAAVQDLTTPDHVELQTLRAKVVMEDKSTVTMDARRDFSTASNRCWICARSLPAILHRLRSQTYAGLCRHQQGIGDVGRTCRRQTAEGRSPPTSSKSSTAARSFVSKATS